MSRDAAAGLVEDLASGISEFIAIPSAYSELLTYRRTAVIGVRLHHGEEQDVEAARGRLVAALNAYEVAHNKTGEDAVDQIGGLAPDVVDTVVRWLNEAARPPK